MPGDGGNQLEAKLNKSETVHYICDKVTKDYYTLWLNIGEFVEVIIDCWVCLSYIIISYDDMKCKSV